MATPPPWANQRPDSASRTCGAEDPRPGWASCCLILLRNYCALIVAVLGKGTLQPRWKGMARGQRQRRNRCLLFLLFLFLATKTRAPGSLVKTFSSQPYLKQPGKAGVFQDGSQALVVEVLYAKEKMHQSCAISFSDNETIGAQSLKLPLPDRSCGEVFQLSVVEAIYLKTGGGEVEEGPTRWFKE